MMVQSEMLPAGGQRRLAIEGGEPLYRGSHFRPHPIPEEGRAAAAEVLQSGRLFRYAGEEVTRMEHEWARYLGVRFALAVSSASSAIELALLSTGLRPGDDVLLPAFTFSAVPSATVHAGGRPILVEVGADYTIDFADLDARLTPRSRHLLLTHMRGHVCDMDAIRAFCAERKLLLIEDAAHALGVLWDGHPAGTMGLVGCYSFQSDKIINGGEGGLLITNDEDVIVRATLHSGCYERYWSQHGYGKLSFPELQRQLPLYNMRMTNLTAVLIASQIGVLEERVVQCARNHRLLTEILAGSPHVRLPPRHPKLRPCLDTIQFTLVGLDEAERREFARAVQMEGIGLTIFGLDPNNARAFWNWEYLGETPHLPRTEAMLKATCDLRLPATLASDEITAIGGVILDALDHATMHRREERREVG
jgi:dTDP-4-amino-4,6-dideoxygalactose transaminase